MRRITSLLSALVLAACGGGEANENSQKTYEALEDSPTVEEDLPEYVVVDLTTKFYFTPEEGPEFLQYRTPEEQVEVEEKLREDAIERARSLQERFEKEIEREKKRMKRIKDPEKRNEYAIERRDRRARRFLKLQRRRARRSNELPPESRFIVLEKLEETAKWVKVRTLSDDEQLRHCYSGGLGAIGSLDVELWVQRDQLEPVVRRRERVGLWRGTEVKLAPGVVVEERDDTRYALVDGYRIEVKKLDLDSIASSYESPSLFGTPVTDTQFTDIALAEGTLRLNRDQFLPYNPYQNLYVTATMWVGSRFYATTRTSCGEYTVLTSEEDLRPAGQREALRIAGAPPTAAPPLIKRGSRITRIDGGLQGVTNRDIALPQDMQTVDGRKCATTWIWEKRRRKKDESRRLVWCVDREDIQLEAGD